MTLITDLFTTIGLQHDLQDAAAGEQPLDLGHPSTGYALIHGRGPVEEILEIESTDTGMQLVGRPFARAYERLADHVTDLANAIGVDQGALQIALQHWAQSTGPTHTPIHQHHADRLTHGTTFKKRDGVKPRMRDDEHDLDELPANLAAQARGLMAGRRYQSQTDRRPRLADDEADRGRRTRRNPARRTLATRELAAMHH